MSSGQHASIDLGATVGIVADALNDDIEVAIEVGLGHARITLSWADMQPKPGTIDGAVVESIRHAAASLRSRGVGLWVGLLSPDIPRWFDNEGGFTDSRTAGHWWPRWVEEVAGALGDDVAGWIPFEAPTAMAERLIPNDPRRHGELVDTLIVAWRDAWRVLHGPVPIAASLDVRAVHIPADDVVAAELARREEHLRWRTWLRALRDGTLTIPGRADRRLADMDGACDVLGIATSDVGSIEASLHRVAEQGPDRPLAVTFRPTGPDLDARAESAHTATTTVTSLANSLPIERLTLTDVEAAARSIRG